METVTPAEHSVGRLDAAKLARLCAEFDESGFVILANVPIVSLVQRLLVTT